MRDEEFITRVRAYYYAVGILGNQQNDPLCAQCAAFTRMVDAIVDRFVEFQNGRAADRKRLPEEFAELFADIADKIAMLDRPDEPVRQKKAGNCKLPSGLCFTKDISAFFEKLGVGKPGA